MTPTPVHDDYADERVGFLRRCGYLFGPGLLAAAIVGIVYLVAGQQMMTEVATAGGISLFGAGTTIIFGKAVLGDQLVNLSLGTWHLAFIAMFVNAASAFWYAYNLDLLQKLPKIGPYMRRARANAVKTLEHRPWIRRWAVVGVGLFVVTPLPGSGALGGGFMGRILGISKKATFISVSIAGVIVSVAYAMLARELEALGDRFEEIAPSWLRVTVAVLLVIVMIWLMSKLIRWFASHPPEDAVGGEGADAAPEGTVAATVETLAAGPDAPPSA